MPSVHSNHPVGHPTGQTVSKPKAKTPFKVSFAGRECGAINDVVRTTFRSSQARFNLTFGGTLWVLDGGRISRHKPGARGWLEERFPRLFRQKSVPRVTLFVNLNEKSCCHCASLLPESSQEQIGNLKEGVSTGRWKIDLTCDDDPTYVDNIVFFNGSFFLSSVSERGRES